MSSNSVFSFKHRTEPIQVLRACLAILVFLSHFESTSEYLSVLSTPVFLFYTISGFLVMLSTRKEEKVKGFLKRRFIRLLPLYWTLTILTFAVANLVPSFLNNTPTIDQLIKSMLCIPYQRITNVASHTTMRPIVGPAHTLEVEVIFSIIFFICMKISHKHRGKIAAGVCLLLFFTGETFRIFHINTSIDFIEFYVDHNSVAWLYFFSGIVLFKMFNTLEKRSVSLYELKKYLFISISLSVYIFVIINIISNGLNPDVYYILQAGAGFFLIAFLILLSQYSVTMPKFLVFFGDISFSFYLIHYYVVHLSEKLLHVKSFGWTFLLAVVISLTVSILIALGSYQIFEKRIPKLLSRNK